MVESPSVPVAQPIADWIMLALFGTGILVLMFHAWEFNDIGPVAQVVGVVLLLAAGGLAWLFGCKMVPPGPVELCLLAMGFLSLIRLAMNGEISPDTARTSLSVSVILLLALIGNAALVRRISMERLLNVSATALAVATVPVLLFENEGIIGALTAGDKRWAWLFRPFDLHHSLASIIFSLGVMLSVYRIVSASPLIKVIFSAALLAQATIILATGGRTGLVACTFSLLLVFITRIRNTPPMVWFGVATAALGSLWFLEEATSFLSTMMELDSNYRGFGTGATGRTEVWKDGFELILADPVRLLFGSGLRTAGVEEIGFNPENSYIAIALESGGIMLLWFVAALIATIVRLHYHARDPGKDTRLILYGILPIIQFALIVGIFNRQLLSVGNPASNIFLVVFVGAWTYVSGPVAISTPTAGPAKSGPVAEPPAARRRRKAAEGLAAHEPAASSSAARLRRLRAASAGSALS